MDMDTASEECMKTEVAADPVTLDTKRMFENIALSKARIKNQQRDEEELPTDEREKILEDLFKRNPAVFLERYHLYLCEDDIPCFDHVSAVYEVQFYLKEAQKRLSAGKASVLVKNRRYEALKKLESEGSYFSDDEMRSRDPLMYEQLVGQYLTDEELNDTRAKIDPSDLRFSTILTTFIAEQETKALLKRQQDLEDAAEEEEEDEDEEEEEEEDKADDEMEISGQKILHTKNKSPREVDEDSSEDDEEEDMDEDGASSSCHRQPTPATEEEKALLREEFLSHMRERFLSGEDKDFDYGAVDSNVEYDSLAIRGWDEEEKYFDEESPHDTEEEASKQVSSSVRTDSDNDVDDYEKWTPQSDVIR
ncbi:coiled-coil domain-containing protein 97-like [Diadema setosum]|uniref:coiled-coil domain-containing protein 97-like n=1 Tax=Diadema setosum TaxID=31175 RepID=UPI003B3A1FE1